MPDIDDIPVLTEVIDPDDFVPVVTETAEVIGADNGARLDVDKIANNLSTLIAEQIEGELRLQLEARVTQALESALPQIRQEVRDLLKAELGEPDAD